MMKALNKQHFNSLGELYKFITTTPENIVFRNKKILSSFYGSKEFTRTESFEEAIELMHNGWHEMAKKLEGKLKTSIKNIANKSYRKSVYDVIGGNVSVPRYLQGIPTNMIYQKTITKKQPVITINKAIGYNCNVKQETIVEESIKALKIVREIEATGVRVNLNIFWQTSTYRTTTIFTVRIKNANERLNVSKMAFPLVHPSMLRRIMFRVMETSPIITDMEYDSGYGVSEGGNEAKKNFPKNEIFLPSFILNEEEFIKKLQK